MPETNHQITCMPVGMLMTNCYIVVDADGVAAVIDPGGEPQRILKFLADRGLDCQAVLLTHGHYDHVDGLEEVLAKTGAKLVCSSKTELEQARKADVFAKEGETIAVGKLSFSVMETPGHTPDGVCYRIGDDFFSGDTLFFQSIGRTDFPGGNMRQLQESLNRIVALGNDEMRIYPGHMQQTTLGYERVHNPFLR